MMTTIADIAKIMMCLKSYFPNYNPADTNQTAKALLLILGDVPFDLLEAATMSLCAEKRFFAPSAGELRTEAMRLAAKSEHVPDVWEAYFEVRSMPFSMKVVDRVEIIGGVYERAIYKQVTWSHKIIEKTAVVLGWPDLFPTEHPDNDRAQFAKVFDSFVKEYYEQRNILPFVKQYLLEQKYESKPELPINSVAVKGNKTSAGQKT